MRTINVAKPREILRTLELRSLSPEIFANSLRLYEEPQDGPRGLVTDMTWLLKTLGLDGVGIRNDSDLEQCVLATQFRELVDEWIETGRHADGSESPSSRNLFHTSKAIQAVKKCARETPLQLMVIDKISELVVAIGTESAHPELPVSFYHWAASFGRGLKEASRLFTGLMASDWKESICKCRYEPCSRYFLFENPRRSYAHGTFCCREHQSRASADALTRNSRTRAQMKLIEAAARQLVQWGVRDPLWQDDNRRKRRLAEKLCEVIARTSYRGYRQELKVNWVTWHRRKIEQKRLEISGR